MWGRKKTEPDFEIAPTPSIPPVQAQPAPAPAPVALKASSVIAPGVVVNGSITCNGDILIEGAVNGDVRAAALTIGREGVVIGNVAAETATVRGKVTGDVRARTIQLASRGEIAGDLTHAVLIIEEGGSFEGRSRRSADPLADEAPQLEAPKAQAAAAPEAAVDASPVDAPAAASPAVAATDEEPRSALADALGDAFKERAPA